MTEGQKWHRDLESLGSHIRDPRVHRLLGYWLSKRGDRRLPSRADIDPAEIPELLPNVILIDVDHHARRFRMRLAGTAICDTYHRDITGEDFENVVGSENYKLLHPTICAVAFDLNIHHIISDFDFGNSNYYYERILLPLSNDEKITNILIGLLVTTFKSKYTPFPLSEILETAELHAVIC